MPHVVISVPYPKVNLVCTKDIHASALPPGRRRGSYMEEIFAKLTFCKELAEKVHGSVLCAGDLFHIKSPQAKANEIHFVTRLMDILQAMPNHTMFGVVGNHDITGDNLQTLPAQPLGNLITAGAYTDLSTSVVFESQDGLRVRVDGYNYERDARVILDAMITAQPDPTCDYRVAVAHAFAGPGKSQPMFGEFSIGFDDVVGTPYNAFLWGHDHKPKGLIQVGEQQHLYLGSLSRAALTADEAERPVSVAVLSFSREKGIVVVEVEVPVAPLALAFHTAALEVERVDKREDVVDQRAASANYLASLQGQAAAVESEDPKEVLLTITDDDFVIHKICEVCDLH